MRIITQDMVGNTQLKPHEKHFLELWYSMTHMRSLDSYRVRCMNSRTVIRELSEELRIGLIKEDELKGLCDETLEILESDPIILNQHSQFLVIIKPFLSSPPLAQNKKGGNEGSDKDRFIYVVRDFSSNLEKSYFAKVITALPEAIKPDNGKNVKALVASLVSDLLDRGWPQETLFGWHRHYLAEKPEQYTFSQNLQFMLKVFTSSPQKHEVSIRLQGGRNLDKLKNYGEFAFVDRVPIASGENKKRFDKKQGVIYAQVTVDEVDSLSAAIRGKEKFEQLVDLLRFDLEPSKLFIDSRCFVKRMDTGKEEFPVVRVTVPNPSENFGHDEFIEFAQDLDVVSNKSGIESSSRRQLQAAIRQYRFGRDSENYSDKFLNWWMGLEALSRVGNGKEIGATVAFNVSRAMVVPYLHRLVRDLATTLKYCHIVWPAELAGISGCEDLDKLTINQLIAILQSNQQQRLWDQCAAFPTVQSRGKEIGDSLTDPKKTALRLKNHMRHLEWHLARLYRIRCCIVHGAPVRFRLGLLAANLEYYLKQIILSSLRTFRHNDQVESLADFFGRAAFAYDRTIKDLEAEGAGPEQVQAAVNIGFVL